MWTRRRFLAASAAAALTAMPLRAIDPIRRDGPSKFRLGLSAYSFRQALTAAESPMTLEEFADRAAKWGCGSVEPTSYYFRDTSTEYMKRYRGHCAGLGLAISGSAVRNDFAQADAAKRARDVDHVRRWLDHTAAMGGKTLRVFAGNLPQGDPLADAQKRCAEGLLACCEHAAQARVFVALENHGGITAEADQLLALVRAVDHPWFGVNLDTGNFRTADPYGDLKKLVPYAVTVQVKTEVQPKGRPKQEADLPRLIAMLREARYSGDVILEYEAKEPAITAVPRYLREMKSLLAG